jgi:hypothetical protein
MIHDFVVLYETFRNGVLIYIYKFILVLLITKKMKLLGLGIDLIRIKMFNPIV